MKNPRSFVHNINCCYVGETYFLEPKKGSNLFSWAQERFLVLFSSLEKKARRSSLDMFWVSFYNIWASIQWALQARKSFPEISIISSYMSFLVMNIANSSELQWAVLSFFFLLMGFVLRLQHVPNKYIYIYSTKKYKI